MHIAALKTQFAQDILLTSDIPIFATGIEMIPFIGRSKNEAGENNMMEYR